MIWSPFLIPVVAIICGAVMAIGIPIARAYARRIEATPTGVPPELRAQLTQMQQAIDAIALEVERISEGQRFTTKLLAERAAGDPALTARAGGEHVAR